MLMERCHLVQMLKELEKLNCEVVVMENRIYGNFIVTVHESGFDSSLSPVLDLYVIVDSNMDSSKKHTS